MVVSFFSEYLMPASLALMMGYIGTGLEFSDFRKLFFQPKSIATGLVSQLVLLPALAFLLAWIVPVSSDIKIGLIIIAACPGGTTSNLLTYLMRGKIELSLTLTTFNSFLIAFTIPFFIDLGSSMFVGRHHSMSMSFWDTFGSVFFSVLIPVLAGMLIRYFWESHILKYRKLFQYLALGFLAIVFAVVIIFEGNSQSGYDHYWSIIYPAFILNLLSFFMGVWVSRLMRLDGISQFTIAIEVGLQNSALAIFVATQLLSNPQASMVPVAYGAFSFLTTAIWTFLFKRSQKKSHERPS